MFDEEIHTWRRKMCNTTVKSLKSSKEFFKIYKQNENFLL